MPKPHKRASGTRSAQSLRHSDTESHVERYDLSIVIVSFNTSKLLDDCLASIQKSMESGSIAYEIIVVDNVSTDGTREMLRRKYPRIELILNDQNAGFGKANNQGIRISKGDYVLLLNSDTVITDNAIGKLFEFASLHPGDFTGPKLLNTDMSPQTSCGPFFTLPVVFASLFLKGDVIGLTRWSPDDTRVVDWVSGACIIAKRTVFLSGLLFDENIFMYMEEIDLLMRAKKTGAKTYFYHEPRIIHLGSGSSTNKRTGPVINIFRGLLFVYNKHYSTGSLIALKFLLRLKAAVSVSIGYITGSEYLKKTYAEAFRLV